MARREADTPLIGAGGDGRCLPRRRARRRQAGPWRAGQDALRGGGLHQPRGPAAQGQAGPGQGLPQARDRRGAKRWLAPGSEVLTDGLRCWNALDGVVGSHRANVRAGQYGVKSAITASAEGPPNATSPASPGDTTGATSSTPWTAPSTPRRSSLDDFHAKRYLHHEDTLAPSRSGNRLSGARIGQRMPVTGRSGAPGTKPEWRARFLDAR